MANQTTATTRPNDELVLSEQAEGGELEDTREGMTTPQKVGVAAGITGATGLAAWGLYKLGSRFGWWGGPTIIIDDEPVDGGGKGGDRDSSGSGSGGARPRGRAIGKPPNISGDPKGYNTELFNNPGPVRLALITLGYKVAANDETLVPDLQPNGEVKRFQNEWNKVIRGLDSGRVEFPPVDDPSKLKPFRGVLVVDGIPGKNTLNALEIAFRNTIKNVMKWSSLTRQT